MSNGFITEIKYRLQQRQAELSEELQQVEKALAALGEETPKKEGKKGKRRRTDLGKVLTIVKESPGIAAVELAGQMSIPEGTAYSALNRLKDRDQVAKLGKGWYPTEQLGAASERAG